MSYKNLGKHETPITHLVSYVSEHFIISYNELNGNYTLYQLDIKTNSLAKVKGGQTPLEYDKIIYSRGKPPKLKDYIEEDYSDSLVYSSTWTTSSNNLVETKVDKQDKSKTVPEKPKKSNSKPKDKSKAQVRKKML